jgi:hypothetical protein
MSLKRLIGGGLVLIVAAAAFGIARAQAGGGNQVMEAIRATAPFHDLAVAQQRGYAAVVADVQGRTCIAQPGVGAMGVHYLDPALLDDHVDADTPEALVFGPTPNGGLRLNALEYIVFQSVWDANHSQPPSLFGQAFLLTPEPNRFGIPAFYALHLWIWGPNPTGMFQPWNPQVTCPS